MNVGGVRGVGGAEDRERWKWREVVKRCEGAKSLLIQAPCNDGLLVRDQDILNLTSMINEMTTSICFW